MIDIDIKDRQRIVRAIEYLIEYGDNRTIGRMCDDCGITFREYRVICDLAMPCMRMKVTLNSANHRTNYYKGICKKLLKEAGKDESYLRILAAGEGKNAVPASDSGDDGEEGHPEEWAI